MFGISLTEFLEKWGYLAVFLGSLVEGEAVILTASALAAAGYLSLPRIMLTAFTGTLLADQGLFFVGYYFGSQILEWIRKRFPKMVPFIAKGEVLFKKYETPYILLFRFIYSIRIISPVIIGSQRVSIMKFCILNIVAAVLWTLVSCLGGYFIGDMVLKRMGLFQQILLVVLVLLIGGLLVWRHFHKKKQGGDKSLKAKKHNL